VADGWTRTAAAVLRTDGIGGRGWITWLLLSHGFVVGGARGLVELDSTVNRLVMAGVLTGSLVASAWFWRNFRRAWRRIEEEGVSRADG